MAAVSKGGLMLRDASQRSRFCRTRLQMAALRRSSARGRECASLPYPACSLSMWASTAGR
jgi:hypothetical protein